MARKVGRMARRKYDSLSYTPAGYPVIGHALGRLAIFVLYSDFLSPAETWRFSKRASSKWALRTSRLKGLTWATRVGVLLVGSKQQD